jgi:hypothetical protein
VRIEVKFIPEGSDAPDQLSVRLAGSSGMRSWSDIVPGQIDNITGYSFEDLFALGEGEHEIKPKR